MPHLPDELVEEVFLRFPPDEPAALVRASLASNPWLSVLTGPAFRRRYREFHGAPPMLGFFYERPSSIVRGEEEDPPLCFVSTAKFGAGVPPFLSRTTSSFGASDCRHGRVLLMDDSVPQKLVVWDPMTGSTRELMGPNDEYFDIDQAAVLCAVNGCDHRACHGDPFKIVCFTMDREEEGERFALACVSSPEMGNWSKPSKTLVEKYHFLYDPCIDTNRPIVLVNDALYVVIDAVVGILKYSLSSHALSCIDAPDDEFAVSPDVIIMAMEDGTLGFASVDNMLTLHMWSRQIDSEGGAASWTRGRVVDLKNHLPLEMPKRGLTLLGSVEGGDIIFVNTELDVCEFDLKTLDWKERKKGDFFSALIPYMSFYYPPERKAKSSHKKDVGHGIG